MAINSFRSTRILLSTTLLAGSLTATAGGFPEKPVTLVVPYPAGGAMDSIARILAKGLTQRLGQPIIVENKAGAGTGIGAGIVARATADGYTLLISANTTYTINPALKSSLPYDPLKSFDSIGGIGTTPVVLLAHPAVAANNVKEVVALAKAKPGALSYASFGNGTSTHFAGEMFKLATGTDIKHIPYRGGAPAMQDLIGGQVQFSFDTIIAAIPQLQGGKIKAIAVMSPKPSPLLPKVPSLAEAGYPGFEMVPWIEIVAPAGLPAATKERLINSVATTVADADIRSQLAKAGVDVAYETPQTYAQRVAKELPMMRNVVNRAAITAD